MREISFSIKLHEKKISCAMDTLNLHGLGMLGQHPFFRGVLRIPVQVESASFGHLLEVCL